MRYAAISCKRIMFFSKNNQKEEDYPKDIIKRLEALEEEAKKSRDSLQKVGMVRFNPFGEIGGDQSFCIAVLNNNNDGFVITSHYGREANRVYAKPVSQGKSQYQLSTEERRAIDEAINITHGK